MEAAITPRTRAIMAVAYGGHPGEIAALRELADARGLVLLEDAAHAIGMRHEGRHLGTFGAAGAFSFFSNKNLAVGEGGAVVTDDDELAERVRLLRSHGMTTLTWDRHRGHAAGYDVVALGFNYRIDEPRAALLTARLERLDGENAAPPRARRALPRAAARAASRPPPRPPTTCSRSCSTRASTATASAPRCPSAGSRRACTTRRPTASRSTPTARPSCR